MLRILLTMVLVAVASGQMFNDNANEELKFENSSDEVRYLAAQNHMLMQRLTNAEADIAELKRDYNSLKTKDSENIKFKIYFVQLNSFGSIPKKKNFQVFFEENCSICMEEFIHVRHGIKCWMLGSRPGCTLNTIPKDTALP